MLKFLNASVKIHFIKHNTKEKLYLTAGIHFPWAVHGVFAFMFYVAAKFLLQ